MAGVLRTPDAMRGHVETTLTLRENTNGEKAGARSAVLRRMELGQLSAHATADLLAMLGLADDLLLPGTRLWAEKAARELSEAKTGRCWAGRHELTPETLYIRPDGRRTCRECRTEREALPPLPRGERGQFLPRPKDVA